MSGDEEYWEDEQQTYSDEPAPTRKKGMSTGVKVLLALGALGGVSVLACCGGTVWWASSQKPVEDPAEIRAMTDEIIGIEIPDQYQPMVGMDIDVFVVQMTMLMYQDGANGNLMICDVQAPSQGEADQELQEQQLRQQLSQQNVGAELTILNSEEREIDANGETLLFTFSEAEDQNGTAYRQVSGTIPSRTGGFGFLILQATEAGYDEEAVVKMLESIRE